MATNSIAGLRRTAERALAASRSLPRNRALFAGKRGPEPEYRRTDDIPARLIQSRLEKPSGENCIHCHNIWDAEHDIASRAGSYDPRKVWKYPPPENIGLVVDKVDADRVVEVLPESPAARAGLRTGDVIEALAGQAILSLADIQFVLHPLAERDELPARVRRGDRSLELKLALEPGWRASDFSWRGSLWAMPPSPGLWVEDLKADERRRLGLAADRFAIKVRGLFKPAVRRSGLKTNDIIVSYDGRSENATAAQFHMHLRLEHFRPGSKLELEVLRDGKRRPIRVEF